MTVSEAAHYDRSVRQHIDASANPTDAPLGALDVAELTVDRVALCPARSPCWKGRTSPRILDCCGSSRLPLEVLAYTGLRIGELLGRTWADVDVANGTAPRPPVPVYTHLFARLEHGDRARQALGASCEADEGERASSGGLDGHGGGNERMTGRSAPVRSSNPQ